MTLREKSIGLAGYLIDSFSGCSFLDYSFGSNHSVYTAGINRSMMVEARRIPDMIAPPKPLHSGFDRVIGKSPITVQSLVRMIGSSLDAPASASASVNGMCSRRFIFILSTINMELVTTIPNSDKTPMSAGNESGVPVSANATNTLDTASGMTIRTIVACL